MSNTSLLVALVILLVVESFLPEETSRHWGFDLMLSGVLVTSVWSAGRNRRLLFAGLSIVVPTLVAKWSFHVWPSAWLGGVGLLFALVLFVFTLVVLLGPILRSATVSRDTMAGAVSAYLLLGVIWAITFALIELAHPGSFEAGGQPLVESPVADDPQLTKFLYLSLVTLTTVGYGDILPVTAVARRMAAMEAIVGQLYLAVLVARLVSQHVTSPGSQGGP